MKIIFDRLKSENIAKKIWCLVISGILSNTDYKKNICTVRADKMISGMSRSKTSKYF